MDTWFSGVNAVLIDDCQALGDVTVNLAVTEDLVTDGDGGFSLQLNAYPMPGVTSVGVTLDWIQFVLYVSNTYGNNTAAFQWQAWALQAKDFPPGYPVPVGAPNRNQPVPTFNQPNAVITDVPSNRLPRGSSLMIALTTDPSSHGVTQATFTVELAGATESVPLAFPADNPNAQFPIGGFQVNLVGPGNNSKATFTSGAGELTYSVKPGSLSIQNGGVGAACGQYWGALTGETSNVVYGTVFPPSGTTLGQSFRLATRAVDVQMLSDGAVFFLAEEEDLLFVKDNPLVPSQVDSSAIQFQGLSDTQVCVLGSDSNLWIDNAPWNDMNAPETRQHVDGDVVAFQALGDNEVYVIGSDHNLWQRNGPWAEAIRTLVDTGAQAVQAFPSNPPRAYVLDTGGTLWGEIGPWGADKTRHEVDTGVSAFQGIGVLDDGYQVFVLDQTGDLYYEFGPWGTNRRNRFDGNVRKFQMIGETEIYVLGDDGRLWLEHLGPPGLTMTRTLIDANVETFHALSANYVSVIGTDGKLWSESGPWGPVPPQRYEIGRTLP